jgi:DNA modification methylase
LLWRESKKSGTSCIAALKTGRNFIGYDINQKYIDTALIDNENITPFILDAL